MNTEITNYDIIIIGGGAAGLMCAIEAGKRGRTVLIIEHNEAIGKKILISGGGRCNFTNLSVSTENFLSENPYFCTSALARYTPNDFIRLVEKHSIAYHEKTLGQLFCDGSARQIVEMLLKECVAARVTIVTNCTVNAITKPAAFHIETNFGEYECSSLVIASGGVSIPKIGASGFGYTIAKQFGIPVTSPKPALVPLIFSKENVKLFSHLSGISLNAVVSCNGQSFAESMLFTHKGLSGPSILQISSYWNEGESLSVNLFPEEVVENIFYLNRQSKVELKTLLTDYLPKRFVDTWCERLPLAKTINQLSQNELKSITEYLKEWNVTPTGTEGFEKAEVTRGGVDTNALSSKTMEAKSVQGLYFIGEVVDVTGWLGGYNFQWAWSSGFAAGQYV